MTATTSSPMPSSQKRQRRVDVLPVGNALHFFSKFWWYDNIVHITLTASLAPILYMGFSRLDVVPDPAARVFRKSEIVGMALIAACLAITAASGYEIYERAVDH